MIRALRYMILAGGLTLAGAAQAGELTTSAQKVEDLLASGQPVAAYDAMLEMTDMVWAKLPLKIRHARYVHEIYAYRQFKAKEKPVFKPNEPHVIYAEPIGFTYGKDANGNRDAGFHIDFVLTDPKGKVLLQRTDFMKINLPLGANNKEVHLNLTVDLTGVPEGDYVSNYVIKDKYSEKQDKITLPFSVAK